MTGGTILAVPIQAVLWDVGGTLLFVDDALLATAARGAVTEEACFRAELAARAKVAEHFKHRAAGGVMPSTEAKDSFRLLMTEIYRGAGLEEAKISEAIARLEAMNRILSPWRRPNPEAGAILSRLAARGIRQAVVSNSDGRVEELLAATGLRDAFEFVIDSNAVGVEKPNPEIFRKALAKWDFRPEEVLYVGDLPPIDRPGCLALGINVTIYDPGGFFSAESFSRVASLDKIWRIVFP